MRRLLFAVLLCLLAVSVQVEATTKTQQQLFRQAHEYRGRGEYENTFLTIEEFFATYPETRNSQYHPLFYQLLAQIYDADLYQYDKAVEAMQIYIDKYPNTRFADSFRERMVYLEENREYWEAIQGWELFRGSYYQKETKDRINDLRGYLSRYPKAPFALEAHHLLAAEYLNQGRPWRGLPHIETYIQGIQADENATGAYILYANILADLKRHTKAIRVLRTEGIREWEAQYYIDDLLRWRVQWVGMLLASGYMLFFAGFLVKIRAYQARQVKGLIRPLAVLIGVIFAVTMGPWALLPRFYEITVGLEFLETLPVMAFTSSAALILIRLLAFRVREIGRWTCLALSLLLIIAAVYIPFYVHHSLFIFWSPLDL